MPRPQASPAHRNFTETVALMGFRKSTVMQGAYEHPEIPGKYFDVVPLPYGKPGIDYRATLRRFKTALDAVPAPTRSALPKWQGRGAAA